MFYPIDRSPKTSQNAFYRVWRRLDSADCLVLTCNTGHVDDFRKTKERTRKTVAVREVFLLHDANDTTDTTTQVAVDVVRLRTATNDSRGAIGDNRRLAPFNGEFPTKTIRSETRKLSFRYLSSN